MPAADWGLSIMVDLRPGETVLLAPPAAAWRAAALHGSRSDSCPIPERARSGGGGVGLPNARASRDSLVVPALAPSRVTGGKGRPLARVHVSWVSREGRRRVGMGPNSRPAQACVTRRYQRHRVCAGGCSTSRSEALPFKATTLGAGPTSPPASTAWTTLPGAGCWTSQYPTLRTRC